jgi:hypothetical protein
VNGDWFRLLGHVGVPAALAFYLVWYTTTALTAQIADHDRRTALSITLLQRICVHTARSAIEVRECLQGSP